MRTAIPLLAALLLLTGCSGGVTVTVPTETSPERPSKTAGRTPTPLPAGCVTPTDGAITLLQNDIAETIPGVTFLGAGAKTGESPGFWYIAITFDDPDLGETTGIWGSSQDITTVEHPAFISVTETAEAVSTYKQPVDFDGVTSALVDMDHCLP